MLLMSAIQQAYTDRLCQPEVVIKIPSSVTILLTFMFLLTDREGRVEVAA